MIIPVLEAVSQATLEKGSCSRHASSCGALVRDSMIKINVAYDGIRDLVTNFVWRGLDGPDIVWAAHTRVTLPYGLRGEEEVTGSKSSANRFTVGSHERKGLNTRCNL